MRVRSVRRGGGVRVRFVPGIGERVRFVPGIGERVRFVPEEGAWGDLEVGERAEHLRPIEVT